jgi:citronellol/citronellal dehydrogenase
MPSSIFAPGLLEGRVALVAGGGGPARAAAMELSSLGATVVECDLLDEEAADGLVDDVLARHGRVDILVNDASGSAEAEGAPDLEANWPLTRAVAAKAMIPEGRGGKIVHLAPAPDEGEHAATARAAVENLTRVLSIEWARYGIALAALTPGNTGGGEELGWLVAYLASPGGDYFSGAVLDLGGA